MSDLKKQLIRLGSTNPELRPHIREVLKVASKEVIVGPHIRPLSASLPNDKVGARGKILEEHFKDLENALQDYVRKNRSAVMEYKESLKDDPRVRDLDKRFRWDLFYALGNTFTKDWMDKVYDYADDRHVDTRLRQIIKKLRL